MVKGMKIIFFFLRKDKTRQEIKEKIKENKRKVVS
jgi:hypothetical protein